MYGAQLTLFLRHDLCLNKKSYMGYTLKKNVIYTFFFVTRRTLFLIRDQQQKKKKRVPLFYKVTIYAKEQKNFPLLILSPALKRWPPRRQG